MTGSKLWSTFLMVQSPWSEGSTTNAKVIFGMHFCPRLVPAKIALYTNKIITKGKRSKKARRGFQSAKMDNGMFSPKGTKNLARVSLKLGPLLEFLCFGTVFVPG